tara:strand:+ start:166 stop:312 length:147 start_codon:yes stop_codon:yes gene_type:complete
MLGICLPLQIIEVIVGCILSENKEKIREFVPMEFPNKIEETTILDLYQ